MKHIYLILGIVFLFLFGSDLLNFSQTFNSEHFTLNNAIYQNSEFSCDYQNVYYEDVSNLDSWSIPSNVDYTLIGDDEYHVTLTGANGHHIVYYGLPFEVGKTYKFGAWIKNVNFSQSYQFAIYESSTTRHNALYSITNYDDYEQYETTYTHSSDFVAQPRLNGWGNGNDGEEYYIKDIYFYEVSETQYEECNIEQTSTSELLEDYNYFTLDYNSTGTTQPYLLVNSQKHYFNNDVLKLDLSKGQQVQLGFDLEGTLNNEVTLYGDFIESSKDSSSTTKQILSLISSNEYQENPTLFQKILDYLNLKYINLIENGI